MYKPPLLNVLDIMYEPSSDRDYTVLCGTLPVVEIGTVAVDGGGSGCDVGGSSGVDIIDEWKHCRQT